jgi:hypothetical protein
MGELNTSPPASPWTLAVRVSAKLVTQTLWTTAPLLVHRPIQGGRVANRP